MKALALLLLLGAPAFAQPMVPEPTLKSVLAGSITNKAKIRWSKLVDGARVEVTIAAGVAERSNPNMGADLRRLPYDLDRNRELERQVKASKLGGSQGRRALEGEASRMLEILAEGNKGLVVVGQWSMTIKNWNKKYPALVALLEPLFNAQEELFQPTRGPER
jgi:hypothetical protein